MTEPFIRFSNVHALLRRYIMEYTRSAKALVMADVVERFLFFIAFGYGLGRAVKEVGGYDYLTFLAPGVVAGSCMFVMVMAMTYGVYERAKANTGVWSSYLATPIKLQEILFVEITYASIRSMPPAIIMFAASYGLGAQLDILGMLLSLMLIFFLNFVYGALALCISVHVKRILYFSYMRGLFMMPMYLFGGIFFDLGNVPDALYAFAHMYPLTYVIEIVRPLAITGSVELSTFVAHVGLLVLVFFAAFSYAIRGFRKRIFV